MKLILFATCISLALSGCGGSGGGESRADPTPSAPPSPAPTLTPTPEITPTPLPFTVTPFGDIGVGEIDSYVLPGQPGLAVARTASVRSGDGGDGIWLTRDFGQTWKRLFENKTRSIRVSPNGVGILFSFADGALQKSEDDGETWVALTKTRDSAQFGGLGVGNSDTELYLVDSVNGVPGSPGQTLYRSLDGGESWAPLDPCAAPCRTFTFQVYGSVIYLASEQSGTFYRSDDMGETWVDVKAGTRDEFLFADGLAADPQDPYKVKAKESASNDGGNTWVSASSDVNYGSAWFDSRIYAHRGFYNSARLLRSQDLGSSFSSLGSLNLPFKESDPFLDYLSTADDGLYLVDREMSLFHIRLAGSHPLP